ncbi:capsule biosynthesis protein [Sphingomonas crocodyli]|uniref:capsular polysaccharide export protein, LipB/KpsS family n=1 Tax=Sphingomonas crocodyli TaxID=1979270 RepID=UPI001F0BD188|nr:capsule biosynthesis protein [Sphingomonas crocodyli]
MRSPPFPQATAEVARVSTPKPFSRSRDLDGPERDRARLVIDAIVAARVGGGFWGATDDPWFVTDDPAPVRAAGDDETGLIAWMRGRAVEWSGPGCFADYANDGLPDPIERLVHDHLVTGVDYRDPFSNRPVAIEATIELLGFWRSLIDRNRGLAVATGIAGWKRREVEGMLWPGTSGLAFERTASMAVRTASAYRGAIAVWPTKAPAGLNPAAEAAGVQLIPVEDGFLRSSGLGSDCHPPHSIILDRRGMHFDPRTPSELELLLAEPTTDPVLLSRAEQLTRTIVDAGLSKYASGRSGFERPVTSKPLVLVTGQVEDDLSVRLGGAGIDSNLELLRRARAAEPDAFLIFKPHPDVDAGHRRGRIPDAEILVHADMVVREMPMAALLDHVDRVHVLTSLTGFEALMRGCEVVTHGQPFYAGWGLTRDLGPRIERREGRTLSLMQLVAATLIQYPRYLDPVTKLPCSPELLVDRLAAQPVPIETPLTRLRRLQGRARRALSRGWPQRATKGSRA